jgi:hypothetical protein
MGRKLMQGLLNLSPRGWFCAALVLCAGIGIAWLDTRPSWDDTGVTAAALFIVAAAASLAQVPPWLASVLVAGPILFAELSGNNGVLLSIPFALAGACAGAFIRHAIVGSRPA